MKRNMKKQQANTGKEGSPCRMTRRQVFRALNPAGTGNTPIRDLVMRRVRIASAERESILSHVPNALAEQVTIGSGEFRFN